MIAFQKKIRLKINNLLGVWSEQSVLFSHSSHCFLGVGGLNSWTLVETFSAEVSRSQERNFGGPESLLHEGDTFSFSDAFRISAGVLAMVPQALRNFACNMFTKSCKQT